MSSGPVGQSDGYFHIEEEDDKPPGQLGHQNRWLGSNCVQVEFITLPERKGSSDGTWLYRSAEVWDFVRRSLGQLLIINAARWILELLLGFQ